MSDRGERERPMVPRAGAALLLRPPVIKRRCGSREIPWYLFLGGLAGASAALALGADVAGNRRSAAAPG